MQRLICALALMAAVGCSPPSEPELTPLNFVVILADDLGYGDLRVTGAPDIATPNVDKLAADGVRFVNSYANAPVCSPTRAALLTGRYQQRAGIDRVIYVDERDQGMTLDAVLLPEVLGRHGYRSAIFGKWHLGYPVEYFPTRQGFDEFTGFVSGNVDYFAHTDAGGNHDLWRNEEEIHDDRYMTGLIADEAVRFLQESGSEPFLLYLPFNAPHDPFQGPGDRGSAGDQVLTRRTYRTREKFREMVEALDANIGRVLAELDAQGLRETTAVFFLSDNGGLPIVARNTPFSGFKTTLWEGGIRSPVIARLPGRFPSGTVREDLAIAMDIFPTILELAGIDGISMALDGISLLPALEDKAPLGRNTLYFHYDGPGQEPQRAMIRNGWKYLSDEAGVEHLFQLNNDPGEQNDMAKSDAERLKVMAQAYEDWLGKLMPKGLGQPERP